MKLAIFATTDFSEASGIFKRRSPRKTISLVSSSALPVERSAAGSNGAQKFAAHRASLDSVRIAQ